MLWDNALVLRAHSGLVLVVCLLVVVPHGLGQRAAAIARIEVALWPEYDRPGAVLVIYRFRLKQGTPLPTTVAIAVPVEVQEPHAVAWKNPQGSLMLSEFRRIVDGDRALILVTTRGLEGQLEFYLDLTRNGPRRRFRFSWPGGIEADALAFEIQHPAGATSFESVPPAQGRAVGQDGLTYERIELGFIDATSTPTIDISYEKNSATLSADTLRPAPPPPSESASERASPVPEEPTWPYFAFGGACFAVGLGLLWWTSRRKRVDRSHAGTKVDPKFCSNCGTKLQPRGKFCIECGTRVRG